MFIEKLAIDKEKIIIGWSDLCDSIVWIYGNWSWGLFIAVLSLLFTARALKKTEESNRLSGESLTLTKRSTGIAERSLRAAKRSVSTSVRIYEKQKKDFERINKEEANRKISALENVILNKIVPLCQQSSSLCDIYFFINEYKNIKSVSFYERKKLPAIEFRYEEGDEDCIKRFVFMDRDGVINDNVLMLCAEFSPDLMTKAMKLNNCVHAIETFVHICLGYSANSNLDAFEESFKREGSKYRKIIRILEDTFHLVYDLSERNTKKYQAYIEFKEAMDKLKTM